QTPLLLLLGARAEPGATCDEEVLLAALDRLLAEGVDLDVQDNKGQAPLHLAALHGLPRVVRGCCARAPTATPGTPWPAARMTWQCCPAPSPWRPNSSPARPAGRPPWHGSCASPAEGGPGGRRGGLSRARSELRIPLDQ